MSRIRKNWFHRYVSWRKKRRNEWESICARCGLCCYQKRYRGGRLVIDLSAPCHHLDTDTRLCKVYPDRFRVFPDCKKVTLYHAMLSGLMPKECAYVRKYRRLKLIIPTARVYDPWRARSSGKRS